MQTYTHVLKRNDLVTGAGKSAVFIVEALIPGIAVASVRAVNTQVTALLNVNELTYVGHLPE